MNRVLFLALFSLAALAYSCASDESVSIKKADQALKSSGISAQKGSEILARISKNPKRYMELLEAVLVEAAADPYLLFSVDKTNHLPETYAPMDLVALDGKGLSVSRAGHRLRKPAFDALKRMSDAAKNAGITLLVSSAFRSYEYQAGVYARNVAEMGEAEAARVSAPPGASQHQLGTAMDFGSITDEFAQTAASRWLVANASTYGFTLSFPKGFEAETGYVWESWHYRYVGAAAAALQIEFFGGLQHHMLRFVGSLTKGR